MNGLDPLKVIDGMRLPPRTRELLRPGERAKDRQGRAHVLPRFFLEIRSWEEAKKRQVTPHFTYSELMLVDCREADTLLNTFPHYVPCAVQVLAQYLERFREKVEAPVYVATNGGIARPRTAARPRRRPRTAGDAPPISIGSATFTSTMRRASRDTGESPRRLGPRLPRSPMAMGRRKPTTTCISISAT